MAVLKSSDGNTRFGGEMRYITTSSVRNNRAVVLDVTLS